jgi:hypothetical protein
VILTGRPRQWVTNYHYSLCNNPDERSYCLMYVVVVVVVVVVVIVCNGCRKCHIYEPIRTHKATYSLGISKVGR